VNPALWGSLSAVSLGSADFTGRFTSRAMGSNPVDVVFGAPYSDAGATATDDVDVTNAIVIDAAAVNVNMIGSYTVTFNLSDSLGNAAI